MASKWKTRWSKEVDRKWIEIRFDGYGVIATSPNAKGYEVRHYLGDNMPTDDIIGDTIPYDEDHEFYKQTVWIRAVEGKCVVTVQDEVA